MTPQSPILNTERFRDIPREPVRKLFENGEWLVPPEQRPRGWETMHLPKPAAPDSKTTINHQPLCVPDVRTAPAYSLWPPAELMEQIAEIAPGGEREFGLPPGKLLTRVAVALRSAISKRDDLRSDAWEIHRSSRETYSVSRISRKPHVANTGYSRKAKHPDLLARVLKLQDGESLLVPVPSGVVPARHSRDVIRSLRRSKQAQNLVLSSILDGNRVRVTRVRTIGAQQPAAVAHVGPEGASEPEQRPLVDAEPESQQRATGAPAAATPICPRKSKWGPLFDQLLALPEEAVHFLPVPQGETRKALIDRVGFAIRHSPRMQQWNWSLRGDAVTDSVIISRRAPVAKAAPAPTRPAVLPSDEQRVPAEKPVPVIVTDEQDDETAGWSPLAPGILATVADSATVQPPSSETEKPEVQWPVRSFLPEGCPEEKQFLEEALLLHAPDANGFSDAGWERQTKKVDDLAARTIRYRRAKRVVDGALSGWLGRTGGRIDSDEATDILSDLWETVAELLLEAYTK